MKATIASLVQNVTQNVSDRIHHGVPRSLDLSYITDRIMAMSQCAQAPTPAFEDDGRTELIHVASTATSRGKSSQKHKENSPADLATLLQKRHNNHALIIRLEDSAPDDRMLLLLRRQLLRHWKWTSPCKERSETPSIGPILELCYIMHAYLSLDPQNVVCVSCSNGKTRSAIVIAAYLKFANRVASTLDGFSLFLKKRCPQLDASHAGSHIPPSLKQFFLNFDDIVELEHFMNPKPLLLRAVAVQGVPVDDLPCIDIWDSRRHVFASTNSETAEDSQWADEEGFYQVNQILEGDFCLLCRFGGVYSNDTKDPSKVLFRYTNSVGFLNSGTYEFPKQKVDMMRRYEASFEEEDFLLTLIFESYWDSANSNPGLLAKDSNQLPPILHGYAALEKGWHLLTEYHAAKPNQHDVDSLKSIFTELKDCPQHICTVALQLTNLDLQDARTLLVDGVLREWWLVVESDDDDDEAMELEQSPLESNPIRPVTPEPTCQDILDILNDVSDNSSASQRQQQQPNDAMSTPTDRNGNNHDTLQYAPIYFPNRGDIVDAFGDYSRDLSDRTTFERFPPVEPLRPRMPLYKRKRQRTEMSSSKKKPRSLDENTEQEREAALHLLEQINHTGITLDDLLQLQRKARQLNTPREVLIRRQQREEEALEAAKPASLDVLNLKSPGEAVDDGPDEDVDGFEVAGDDEEPGENMHVLGFVAAGDTEAKKEELPPEDVPLKDDPEYMKYFKMLKMGLPMDAVKHGMKRDGKDPSVMDLDHNKSVKSQLAPKGGADGDQTPLKNDPDYEKYFKMLKMGLPMDAVKHSMKRDGKDPTVMDLDPEKSLSSQRGSGGDDGPPLKDDPEYIKYFKMIKMGLPVDAVKHSMKRDGVDPGIMDLDPEKSLKSQQGGSAPVDDGPPLKEDPQYEKYFKMLKMGLPIGAVKNALQRDGLDPSVMDLDPEKSIKSQMGGGSAEEATDPGPPLKEDPEYEKYFKMLKMGLPVGAVKNALQRDGMDPSVMDLDPEKSLAFQRSGGGGGGEEEKDTGVPLKDDPEWAKYFKMLKMGLPLGAVKNAVQRDGKDGSIMDLDPDKSIAFQQRKKSGGGGGGGGTARKKPKKRVRRKKIYWTALPAEKVVAGSLWDMVKGNVDMEKLSYDTSEFESLFTESTNPADKKKKTEAAGPAAGGSSKKKKESVQVIDGKRSMNGGIVLARLKVSYPQIAVMVNIMDAGTFDFTQLKALKEFLPTDEEKTNLLEYLKRGAASDEAMKDAMSALPECEKYMVAMKDVKNAPKKFDAMLFKVQFDARLQELIVSIDIVKKACDEVRHSEKLRNVMGFILVLVNQINTGGEGSAAHGFSLEALLKLNEAKAFDKKTSVLHYLVKLIRQNDEQLLDFAADLENVPIAENTILDGLIGDMKALNLELQKVSDTASEEADALEKEGKLPEMPMEAEATPDEKKEPVREESKDEEKDDEKMDVEVSDEADGEEKKDTASEEKDTAAADKGNNNKETDSVKQREEVDDGPQPRTPMEKFCQKARRDVDQALAALETLKDSYVGLLQYFGEDAKMASNDFFGTLRRFIKEFTIAADYVEKTEKALLKEKLKKAAKKAANLKLLGDIAKKKEDTAGGSRGYMSLADDAADGGDPLEGLEAAAAKAAKKKKKKKHGANGKPDMGGIAAMAAAAAGKRKKKPGPTKAGGDEVVPPDKGGIAAMAAAAASKRKPKKKQPNQGESPDMGGIAAMAAAAASKRKPKKAAKDQKAPDMGGIAAMAAAAASKRGPKKVQTEEAPTMGGIAAMAAAAAAKRKPKVKQQTLDDAEDAPTMGGIAAMAAAAASKRGPKKVLTEEAPTMGGIAAMAAAAAAKRKPKAAQQTLDDAEDAPTMGGIAAMAAAAAAKRKPKAKQQTLDDTEAAPTMGGIAAMAAAAAAKRKPKSQSSDNQTPTMGGIAAMAAAAAAKRKPSQSLSDNPDEVPTMSGIAAMAAAAAAKRKTKQQAPPLEEAPSMGGIAAMAAAAAAAKRKTRNSLGDPESSSLSGGGIAAMTAAAAMRSQVVDDEQSISASELSHESEPRGNIVPNLGGIAAMAAAAASKRKPRASMPAPMPDGIASMAAAAGSKRSLELSARFSDDPPENLSGIAAMAAAAASKRKPRASMPTPMPDGIASMAAAAGSKRNLELSARFSDDPPENLSGIAAMAAAAASKRTPRDELPAPAAGGIAELAAAAGSKRDLRRSKSMSRRQKSAGNIAELAAAAGSKRSLTRSQSSSSGNGSQRMTIASMAAAAGSKRTFKKETPPEDGSIAAMAAAAASQRNQRRAKSRKGEKHSDHSGIAAMAAAAALKKRTNTDSSSSLHDIATMTATASALHHKLSTDSPSPPTVGGIAALAAAAAGKRLAAQTELLASEIEVAKKRPSFEDASDAQLEDGSSSSPKKHKLSSSMDGDEISLSNDDDALMLRLAKKGQGTFDDSLHEALVDMDVDNVFSTSGNVAGQLSLDNILTRENSKKLGGSANLAEGDVPSQGVSRTRSIKMEELMPVLEADRAAVQRRGRRAKTRSATPPKRHTLSPLRSEVAQASRASLSPLRSESLGLGLHSGSSNPLHRSMDRGTAQFMSSTADLVRNATSNLSSLGIVRRESDDTFHSLDRNGTDNIERPEIGTPDEDDDFASVNGDERQALGNWLQQNDGSWPDPMVTQALKKKDSITTKHDPTVTTQESSRGSDEEKASSPDQASAETETKEESSTERKGMFTSFLEAMGGSKLQQEQEPPPPQSPDIQKTMSDASQNSFTNFFRQMSGQNVMSGMDADSDRRPSNPLQQLVGSLTTSPGDGKAKAIAAVANDTLASISQPSLSEDEIADSNEDDNVVSEKGNLNEHNDEAFLKALNKSATTMDPSIMFK